ncbi:MAG: ATP-grasp domain-containing protein [Clostridia bacterium]|nr:ATP-grasp domain-containing protein [Clostridia bacterium]
MTCWLIYTREEAERNHHAISFYQQACDKRNIQMFLCYYENFVWGTANSRSFLSYENKEIKKLPDFVIMRATEPFFSTHLETMGCRVFNSARVSEIANDKLKTLQFTASLGVPTPKTRLATHKTAEAIGTELGFPLVMKPRDGHGGQDVLWIESLSDLSAKLMGYDHENFLLQKPVADLGRDLRVYVVGGEVVCAMLRMRDDDFRSNYCLGGRAEQKTLTREEMHIVRIITDHLPLDFAGIDLLYSNGQPMLGEIEDVVGARMLYHLTDLDVIDQYVAFMAKTVSLH